MPTSTHTNDQTATGSRDDQRTADARHYVQQLRAFYVHAGVCAASLVIIFAVNLATNMVAGIAGEWWAWWSVWALIGWVLGLTVHGLVVRVSRPQSSGSAWEEQQTSMILASEDAKSAS